jgi:hypothetical protein
MEKYPVLGQDSPYKYLALSPNFYGFGTTVKQAKKNLGTFGGDPEKCGIYRVPQDYWIDNFGNAHGSERAQFIGGKDYLVYT